jgi:ABC-2 type transport system permease protein
MTFSRPAIDYDPRKTSLVLKTSEVSLLLAVTIQLQSIFLSGFFFPSAAMPAFLQTIGNLVPLRYFLTIVLAVQIKGVGLPAVSNEVIALAIFGLVVMGVAVSRFRKRLD